MRAALAFKGYFGLRPGVQLVVFVMALALRHREWSDASLAGILVAFKGMCVKDGGIVALSLSMLIIIEQDCCVPSRILYRDRTIPIPDSMEDVVEWVTGMEKLRFMEIITQRYTLFRSVA